MFGNLRLQEILLILLVVLLLFGAKRLPELARSVGKSLKIFKSEVKDLSKDDTSSTSGSTPRPVDPLGAPAAPTYQAGSGGTLTPGITPPVVPGTQPDDSERREA